MPAKGTHHPTTASPHDAARVLAAAMNISKAFTERDTVLRELHAQGVAVRDLVRLLDEGGAPLGRQHVHRILNGTWTTGKGWAEGYGPKAEA